MKRLLLIFFTFLFVFKIGQAQTNKYHPFPDSNAVWCDEICGYESFAMTGDTIINAKTYHKIVRSLLQYKIGVSGNCEYNYPYFSTGYFCAIRQDTTQRKVYVFGSSYTNEVVLCDFSLHVGDTVKTFNTQGHPGSVVASIDSVLIGNNYRKRWNVDIPLWAVFHSQIIEGIGSTYGLFDQRIHYGFSSVYGELYCFSQDSKILYPDYVIKTRCAQITAGVQEQSQPELFSVFPNPSNGSFTIDFGNHHNFKEITIIDLLGKIYFEQSINNQSKINIDNLPNGVYILTAIDNENKMTNQKIISCP
jgi:hypothetical protein